jgi:ketosteroid isomerase-like protein
MPEIQGQLRDYFDEIVERVTEEDIRIRATTERGIPVPSARFRPRPLAAGAIGFGLATTLLGVVLVVDRVFGAGVSDVGNGGATGALPSGGQGSPWLFIPVVFGLGLLATGIISMRQNKSDMRERGDGLMQTIEKVEPMEAPLDADMTRIKKRNRRLGWLAGLLAVAVIGLGSWLIVELTARDGASMPEGVQTALDDYNAAWEATDGPAFMEATTEDFTFVSRGSTSSRGAQAGLVDFASYWRVETVEQSVTGDGPYYVASSEIVYTSASPSATGYEGVSILTVEQVDGLWKVSQHTWVGDL